jgi:hypothetical protein
LLGDLAPTNPLEWLQFGGFRWSSWEGVLEGWLLIPLDWVGFRDWASSQRYPMRYPSYPKSLTWIRGMNWEIDRGEGEVFPVGRVLPDCPGKIGLTGFPNRSDGFSPCGLSWGFLNRRASFKLLLFLFKGWEVLEVFWVRFGLKVFWAFPRQNRSDQFAKPA